MRESSVGLDDLAVLIEEADLAPNAGEVVCLRRQLIVPLGIGVASRDLTILRGGDLLFRRLREEGFEKAEHRIQVTVVVQATVRALISIGAGFAGLVERAVSEITSGDRCAVEEGVLEGLLEIR